MALNKNIDYKGIKIESAYYRIWGVYISKDSISFGVELLSSSSGQRIDSNSYQCNYDINGENPFKQAYLYLKTLPEFQDAVDC